MKRALLIISVTVFLGLAVWASIPSGPTRIVLSWDPSPSTTNVDAYCLYESQTVSTPLTNWLKFAVIPGWTNTTFQFSVVPGQWFFYATASNFWGESDPSNVRATPEVPVAGTITIQRAP